VLGADDVPHPDTVEALAEALKVDHVIVQETRGSGDAAGAEERIEDLIARLPFAAYVAVIDTPTDVDAGSEASGYLATALSRRIGEPGLYVVSADGDIAEARMVGTGWDETLFSLQSYTDRGAVTDASGTDLLVPTVDAETFVQTALAVPPTEDDLDYDSVALSDDVVDDLADRERALEPHERPDYDFDAAEPWTVGKRWMVGTTVGAGVLVVLLQSLWGWPGWRRRPGAKKVPGESRAAIAPPVAPDLDVEREAAAGQLTTLAEQLPDAPTGDHADRALLAREVAEPLLDSRDVLDVVGAQVLARAGLRELARASGRARVPYRVCFFDPRHTTATQRVEWRYGDAEVEVPVCRTCRRAVDRGLEPPTLVVGRRGRLRPYYEGDSVWARTGYGSLVDDLGELARQVSADRGRS
jgi:hypothetical protein